MMNKTLLPVIVSLVALSSMAGCMSRAFKEATEFGGKGSYSEISPLPGGPGSTPLGAYTMFELEQLADDSGGHTPQEMFAALPDAFAEAISEKGLPHTSGKTLLVRGTVIYYESANLVGQAFGPLEEVVARVQLVDEATGRVLGEANVVGRTKTTRNQSPRQKAVGLARGIVKWIDENFPEQLKVSQ